MLHYRVGKTYDIAQTNFPPEKYPELLSRGIPSDKHGKCVQAICEYCETELHVPVIMVLSRKLNDALSSRLFYAHFDSHRDISHFKSSCFCELFF